MKGTTSRESNDVNAIAQTRIENYLNQNGISEIKLTILCIIEKYNFGGLFPTFFLATIALEKITGYQETSGKLFECIKSIYI